MSATAANPTFTEGVSLPVLSVKVTLHVSPEHPEDEDDADPPPPLPPPFPQAPANSTASTNVTSIRVRIALPFVQIVAFLMSPASLPCREEFALASEKIKAALK